MKTRYPVRCSLFSLLFSSFLPAIAQSATPYFDARFRAFETPEPGRVIVTDMNEDGLPDVVMNCAGGVGVVQGRSDGDLGPFVLWPTGVWPNDIAIGDLDNDGNLDCVTVEQENQVSILFGKGDGTFEPRQIHATTDPSAVGIGYFNHDARPDILVANYSPKTLSVMLQNVDGSFAAPIVSPSGGFAGQLIVRDMDLDNNDDVVYSGNLGYAVVYGNGDGSFGTVDFTDPLHDPRGIAVGNLDADNRPDLVVSTTQGVFVRLGGPNRTFSNPVTYSIGDVGNNLTLGDVTQDGNLDVLVCTNNKSCISILPGFGNGTLGPYALHTTGQTPRSVGIADFTHDGITDLVSSDGNGRTLCLHEGNGDNSFGHQESYNTFNFPNDLILRDMNLDNRPDVIFSSGGFGTIPPPRVWISLTDASGNPGAASPYDCDAPAMNLVTSDFNNDGYLDLAAGRFDSTACLWLNNGAGGLGSRIDLPVHFSYYLVSGDFNEDGTADLFGLDLWEPSVKFLAGNGDGTFDPPLTGPFPNYVSGVTEGDVNGDGHLDLVYSHYSPGRIALWLGDGTGQFSQGSTLATGDYPFETILADIDQDGCPDLASPNHNNRNLSVFGGHCDGTFDAPVLIDIGTFPKGVVCADLDGDPYPDLAVANSGGNTVSLLRGNGAFGFARTDLGTGHVPSVVAAGDFRLLGKMDLLTLNPNERTFSILRNNGSSTVGVGDEPRVELKPRLRTAPNPFDASTTLSVDMPQPGRLRITIHDIQGRTVRELTDQLFLAGEYHIVWDGKDRNGVSVVPGLYLARLEAPSTHVTRKMFRISRH